MKAGGAIEGGVAPAKVIGKDENDVWSSGKSCSWGSVASQVAAEGGAEGESREKEKGTHGRAITGQREVSSQQMLCRMWQKGDEEELNEQGIYKI
jgi:hypothetical protein